MLDQTINNYLLSKPMPDFRNVEPQGNSCSPRGMVFHILEDNSGSVEVLDIGFGTGALGTLIKRNPQTSHWHVDGVDGFAANCYNPALLEYKAYRNVWHGLAQDIPADRLGRYTIICLLDVIEHLSYDTARCLMRKLLSGMGERSYLFVSTPLWFYPQDQIQESDLEEHLIGVPATSMMALLPKMYSINHPLIGGFVYGKKSLAFADFFYPTTDKSFTMERGLEIASAIGLRYQPGKLFKFEQAHTLPNS